MIIEYELDALDIAKILAKHFGIELKMCMWRLEKESTRKMYACTKRLPPL